MCIDIEIVKQNQSCVISLAQFITENKTKVLRIVLAFVLFFPFSISHSKVMNIEIFTKVSHELLEYGTNIRYDRL